jgi:hypothetical protein
MRLDEAEGFTAWASMLVNNRDCHSFPEIDAQINFLGKRGDSAYLVINVYTSETSGIEYVFLAEKDEDKDRRIVLIFDFLKTVGYSFRRLLDWLEGAAYVDHEMGDRIVTGGLVIRRDAVRFAASATVMDQN